MKEIDTSPHHNCSECGDKAWWLVTVTKQHYVDGEAIRTSKEICFQCLNTILRRYYKVTPNPFFI